MKRLLSLMLVLTLLFSLTVTAFAAQGEQETQVTPSDPQAETETVPDSTADGTVPESPADPGDAPADQGELPEEQEEGVEPSEVPENPGEPEETPENPDETETPQDPDAAPAEPVEVEAEKTLAASDVQASGTCGYKDADHDGSDLTWSLSQDGVLTISGTGAMADYDPFDPNLEPPWAGNYETGYYVKSVVLEHGVTSVGRNAFIMFRDIESVEFSDTLTSIGVSAFEGCLSLAELDLPESLTTIGSRAFRQCNALTQVHIPAGVTSIPDSNQPFIECQNIEAFTVDEGNESYRAQDGVLFDYNMTELIAFPAAKTGDYSIPEGVTSIPRYAFSLCSGLTKLTLPSTLTTYDHQDFGASLTAIAVAPGNTAYSSKDGVLFNLDQSEIFAFPSGKGGVYEIPDTVTWAWNNVFSRANSLTEVTVPASMEQILGNVFYLCESLEKITIKSPFCNLSQGMIVESIPDIEPHSVTLAGYDGSTAQTFAEEYGFKFESLGPMPEDTEYPSGTCGAQGDNLTWALDANGVLTIRGEGDMMDFSYGTNPWYQNGFIKSLVIEEGVTSISDGAFGSCAWLKQVELPSTLEKIGYNAFGGGLTEITIPAKVTSIADMAFIGCYNLTAINVETESLSYSSQEGVLFNKDGTRLIQYPIGKAGVYVIPTGTREIDASAFRENTKLTKVTIPAGVTAIKEYTFYGSGLVEVNLPEGLQSIDPYAFEACRIREITVPGSVNSIAEHAFGYVYDPGGGTSQYPGFTVIGTSGTEAETYARANSLNFVPREKAVTLKVEKQEATPEMTLFRDNTDQLLTAEEEQQIVDGNVEIKLTVSSIAEGAVKQEEKEAVEAQAAGYEIGQYLDLGLEKVVSGQDVPVTEADAELQIAIHIPLDLYVDERSYSVVRVHDGVAEVLKDQDDDPCTITIATDKFSTYAIAYREAGDVMPGDVTGDGVVNLSDVTRLFNYVSGFLSSTVDNSVGDVTGDGQVNLSDVTRLFNFVSGFLSSL